MSNRIDEIKICRACGFNNGKPGGKEYWVIYFDTHPEFPAVTESLDAALRYVGDRVLPANDSKGETP